MNNWYPRPVFFVNDVQASLRFYIDKLGFTQDWAHEETDEIIVAQVSRDSFELILNKDCEGAGKSRVFISLWDEHIAPLKQQIESSGILATNKSWGMPVTEILDLDKNEILFSPPVS